VVGGEVLFIAPHNTRIRAFPDGNHIFDHCVHTDEADEKHRFIPSPEFRESLEEQGFPTDESVEIGRDDMLFLSHTILEQLDNGKQPKPDVE
jgi:hypothetical protein